MSMLASDKAKLLQEKQSLEAQIRGAVLMKEKCARVYKEAHEANCERYRNLACQMKHQGNQVIRQDSNQAALFYARHDVIMAASNKCDFVPTS